MNKMDFDFISKIPGQICAKAKSLIFPVALAAGLTAGLPSTFAADRFMAILDAGQKTSAPTAGPTQPKMAARTPSFPTPGLSS
jgi:hypothetical protein